MPEANTTPTTSRRSALRGFGLTAIAAGLAVPVRSHAATAPDTDDADAELIRLCAEIVTIRPKLDAVHAVRHTFEDERRTEPELDALTAREMELVGLIEDAVPPTTMAGARALAGASLALAVLNLAGETYFEGGDAEWLGLTVVQFLAGGEVT
jgi:hypothetical protein